MIEGLVVTHGELAKVLIDECTRILGPLDHVKWMDTHRLSAVAITDKVKNIIGNKPFIVFVDCPGTAPALRSLAAIQEGQAVVTGVNLPMLMSFIVHREQMDVPHLARKMVTDGIRTLEVLWPIPENGRED